MENRFHLFVVKGNIDWQQPTIYIDFTDNLQTYTDNQTFLEIIAHVQAVNTMPFLSSHMMWEQGYDKASYFQVYVWLKSLHQLFSRYKYSFVQAWPLKPNNGW